MRKIEIINKEDFKNNLIEVHKLLNEFEEKLLTIINISDLHELVYAYFSRLRESYNCIVDKIDEFPYDKGCDDYLVALSDEIEICTFNYFDFDEEDEFAESLNEYISEFVELIEIREKRLTLFNPLFKFIKKHKIEINKNDIYKEINLKSARMIKLLELDSSDSLCVKNKIFLRNFLNDISEKFGIHFNFCKENDKDSKIYLCKDYVTKLITECISKYKKLGITLSNAYKNISFDRIENINCSNVIKISFLDKNLKNLITSLGTYKDFVFVKNLLNNHVGLFYKLKVSNSENETIIYRNLVHGINQPVHIFLSAQTLSSLPLKSNYDIVNENSLYKIKYNSKNDFPMNYSYETLKYVENYITCPLLTSKYSFSKANENLIYNSTSKNINLINAQIVENLNKGSYNSIVYTDINENIDDIIDLLRFNAEFSRIFKKYKKLNSDNFLTKTHQMQEKYEKILFRKQKNDKDYVNNIDLPLPILLFYFKESLELVLDSFQKEKKKIGIKFVENIYDNIAKNTKLYKHLIKLNKNFINFNFLNDDIEDLSDENSKIYKA